MKKTEFLIVTIMFVLLIATGWAGIGSVSVGPTTPVTVLSSDGLSTPNRWYIIQNTSTNDVYLKMDGSTNALTTTNGVKLSGGGSIAVTATQAANPARLTIKALSGSGTNTVVYQYGNEPQ